MKSAQKGHRCLASIFLALACSNISTGAKSFITQIPDVRYRNPDRDFFAAIISNTAPDNEHFNREKVLWPLPPAVGVADSFGLAHRLDLLAKTKFATAGANPTNALWMASFGDLLRRFRDSWNDKVTCEVLWNTLKANRPDIYNEVHGYVDKFLNDSFMQTSEEDWISLGQETLWVPDDGFYACETVVSNPHLRLQNRRVYEFATVLFLERPQRPGPKRPTYDEAVTYWLAVERDARSLPGWQRLEKPYTKQSEVIPKACVRTEDGKRAYWSVRYAPTNDHRVTLTSFEWLDSAGHRVCDYWATALGFEVFRGRDTLVPVCDAAENLVAVIAVSQVGPSRKEIHGPQLIRENLGNMRKRVEELWHAGAALNPLLRPGKN